MKTLNEIIKATEARGASVWIKTADGKAGELGCLSVLAVVAEDRSISLTGTMVGPDLTTDNANFDYYVADLDDPKTWTSSGVVKPQAA